MIIQSKSNAITQNKFKLTLTKILICQEARLSIYFFKIII